ISQVISAVWVLRFLLKKDIPVPLKRENIRLDKAITWDICRLGASNFIMQGTNFAVQVVCNSTLARYGGDLYVGIMTVTNSVREIFILPINGIISGAQPVISYNYGAKANDRVRSGINFNTALGVIYTALAWIAVLIFPRFFFTLFSDDPMLMSAGTQALKIYFFGFVFMALQFAGQSTFQALGDARHAIFFSLLRKAFIVVPLTLILPAAGFGVTGVFLAEPISNVIGGIASYSTMRVTAYRKLK
nr:MATE family efflux transporter [Lachnospiraceae bacterium]